MARSTDRRLQDVDDKAQSQSLDLQVWPGWVELESEPAYFNTFLKDMGVRGVKVQEVIDLDDIAFLPQPVYALIFLFKYKDSGREDANADFPSEVWFARQTAHNACATYALLNIVNNIPNIELVSRLENFKLVTQPLTPLEKGNAVDDLHFVRAIHNSFATGNDLIVADQYLQRNIRASKRRQAAAKAKKLKEEGAEKRKVMSATQNNALPSRTSGRLRGRADLANTSVNDDSVVAKKLKLDNGVSSNDGSVRKSKRRSIKILDIADDGDAAFHFCGYMPIDGRLWRLDGMEPTPQVLTEVAESWLEMAVPFVQEWMAQYGDNIEFCLMAVVRDPAEAQQGEAAAVAAYIRAIETKLSALAEDWHELDDTGVPPRRSDSVNGFNDHSEYASSLLSDTNVQQLRDADDLSSLLALRKAAVQEELAILGTIRDEHATAQADETKSFHRRHDYASFVRAWMQELADADLLDELL